MNSPLFSRIYGAARKIPSRSSTVTGRGLTRRMRLMRERLLRERPQLLRLARRGRAAGAGCRCRPAAARPRRWPARPPASSSRPVTSSPSSRAIAANSRLPRRQVEAHHVRQQQAVAGAVRAVRRAADGVLQRVDQRRRRRWRTPCPASVARQGHALAGFQVVAVGARPGAGYCADQARSPSRPACRPSDAGPGRRCVRRPAAESRRCRRPCTPRWRASGRRCRCRPSPSAGRTRVSSGSTRATRGRR